VKKLLLIFIGLVLIPLVLASGEVTKPSSDRLIMNYDDTIRRINDSPIAWAEDTPIQFFETDDKVSVEYQILNNNFFELKITNSPTGTENQYIFLYCSQNEILDYDRFNYQQDNKCPENFYAYKLRDIREGQKLIIKIPPLNEQGQNSFFWYVGGDINTALTSAGGGGGLPVCSYMVADIYRNQSTGIINYPYIMKSQARYVGTSSTGCVTTTLYKEQWFSATSKYSTIKTNNDTNELDCNGGVLCRVNSPAFNTWYTSTINCDVAGNVSTRTRLTYTLFGNPANAYSTVLTQECTAPYVPPIEENGTMRQDLFLDEIVIPEKNNKPYWLLYTAFPVLFIIADRKRKKH
jgi:hypothetical protein